MENRIIGILPNKSLVEKVISVQKKCGINFPVYHMQTEDAVKLAREKINEGAKVILSRGMTANYLKNSLDIPVIDIKYDFFHFANALKNALEINNEVALIGFIDAFRLAKRAVEYIEKEGQKIHVVILPDGTQIEANINGLHEMGINTFVGGNLVVSTARRLGFNHVLIEADERVIDEAITNALYELRIHIEQEEKYELIKSIISNMTNGIFAINKNGELITANPIAMKYLGISSINKSSHELDNIISGSKIMKTIDNGELVNGDLITIGENDLVVSSSPINVEGEIRGAVVTIQEISSIKELDTKIRKKQMHKGHVARKTFDDIIGISEIMKSCKSKAFRYSQVDSTVLIRGDTGTGKEIFAQSIHNASKRASKPFVAINCAALPPNLLESELFGYVKGAFSGANYEGKAGIFELAHTGTIFLDEISEASLDVQARLLRVIQEKEIIRIGDDKVIPVDVRILSATNKDLLKEVFNKSFREDLYYRLSVLELQLPSLEKRKTDIPELAEHLIYDICGKMGVGKVDITEDAIKLLKELKYEGNVRHLSNILERAFVISNFERIDEKCILEAVGTVNENNNAAELFETKESITIAEMERMMIKRALRECGGNKTAAARKLGISLSTMWRKVGEIEGTVS
ncbi:sigma 54-interacting transcriptional regulator [Sedimentibacter sp.]|uniref:sigma 54-interacting transcriptional regulator n=1 Tax=Sedimentibacter sp. TaxID=1960295 RepID=UPI000ED98E79|nr:sigma 54-interacting transcriptional regulator [Sedimentibacter sp.]HCX62595.1 transcriptional regulator [Clostridiales bacterium]